MTASPAVYLLTPPYERYAAVARPQALPGGNLEPGAVLVVALEHAADEWPAAAALVPRVREAIPAVPVVLRLPRRHGAGDLDLGRRAAALHVRAILSDDELPGPALRERLGAPIDFPGDLEEWLALRGAVLPPALVRLVREIAGLAPRCTGVRPLLATLGWHERTARAWCHRAAVPGPGKWLAVLRALHAALRLQHDPGIPLLTVAVDGGYSDHSSLSRQMLRLFGARPGAIRATVGWEWLLDRWIRRQASERLWPERHDPTAPHIAEDGPAR